MKLSKQGADMIKGFEGCVLKAYRCPANVLTIGYGHTGPDVTKGLLWTQQQADEAFAADVERFERGVSTAVGHAIWCEAVEPYAVEQDRFDALVSLAFNIGMQAFHKSTLLKRLMACDLDGAAEQFTVWNKAKGKFNPGLLARRTKEMRIFLCGH